MLNILHITPDICSSESFFVMSDPLELSLLLWLFALESAVMETILQACLESQACVECIHCWSSKDPCMIE